MKKVLLIVGILLFIFIQFFGPTQDDAKKYNDSIVYTIEPLTEMQVLVGNQLDLHNGDSLKITLELFIQQAEITSENLAKVKILEDNNEFGRTAAALVAAANSMAKTAAAFVAAANSMEKNESALLSIELSIDSLRKPDEDIENLFIKLNEQIDLYGKANEDLINAQIAFAEKWNCELNKNK